MTEVVFFSILVKILPLISETVAFTGSVNQQWAVASFSSRSMPPSAHQAACYHWLVTYRDIIRITVPTHLTTIGSSLLNMRDSKISIVWWIALAALVAAHSYPVSLGLSWLNLTEADWKKKTPEQAQRFMQDFVDINGRRLLLPDLLAWGTALLAVTLNLTAWVSQGSG
ncbi:hypothetical protein EKO27_g3198 [Xylaria grammica]|uniref:Uncharacterized protein n=1 Tax=Xylaria grammica TaxID=363999 RepID=A0A439DBX7_9PEZI|nr:hypothetical protein EKO27_g3198 [Xylaria grammica]